MRLLVTGGAGFIFSNFINQFINDDRINKLICIDKLSYASNLKYLGNNLNHSKFEFINYDLSLDICVIKYIIKQYKIDHIIHGAASSHVDRSIKEPRPFIDDNIIGTFNLLEAAKQAWDNFDDKKLIAINTDESFGSLEIGDSTFTEESKYSPNSIYSASKAS